MQNVDFVLASHTNPPLSLLLCISFARNKREGVRESISLNPITHTGDRL